MHSRAYDQIYESAKTAEASCGKSRHENRSYEEEGIHYLRRCFSGVLVISALAVYLIGGRRTSTDSSSRPAEQQPAGVVRETPQARPPVRDTNSDNVLDRLFGNSSNEDLASGERWAENLGRLSLRLLLAALLGAALAFRPRKRVLALKRNPYVSETQILLAIVAAALMIIVGDNAARARYLCRRITR